MRNKGFNIEYWDRIRWGFSYRIADMKHGINIGCLYRALYVCPCVDNLKVVIMFLLECVAWVLLQFLLTFIYIKKRAITICSKSSIPKTLTVLNVVYQIKI